MKPRNRFLALVLAVPIAFISGCNDAADGDIRDVFDAFNQAFDSKNGAAVLELIDEKYVEQMDYLMNQARTAPHEQVYKMSPSERMWIASIRNRLSKEDLAKLDGRGVLKLSVDQGWNLDDAGEHLNLSLGPIKFRKPRAFATMLEDGEDTGFRYEFVEVDHKWKIDPSCEDKLLDKIIEKLARLSGFKQDTWIKQFESAATGKTVTDSVWDPPK